MKILNSLLAFALLGIVGCSKPKEEHKEVVKKEIPAPKSKVSTPAPASAPAQVDDNARATEYVKGRDYTEESLSYRNKSLSSEDGVADTIPDAQYHKEVAGTSTKIERAFDNAPPMIPHDVEGMLPIKIGDNQCMGCHMPEVAPSVGATPIPPTHFTNYRPTTEYKNGELVKEGKTVGPNGELGNSSDIVVAKAKKLNKLYGGRYNCSQCHAPQANVKPLVESTFKGGFRDESGKHKSNLKDTFTEGM